MKRSVLFFRNSYYHFYYLAKALRKRGWDAIVVSPDNPKGAEEFLFHGEDYNIYSDDAAQFRNNISLLFEEAKSRFELLHFCGDHCLGLFQESHFKQAPPEILEWKKLGKKIAFTPSGCLSFKSQKSIVEWSLLDGNNLCSKCRWENEPGVCSNYRNLHFGRKMNAYCDVIFGGYSQYLDYMAVPKNCRESILALDENVWHPDLEIPEQYIIPRQRDEILIYHTVGNYQLRTTDGKNIKGTHKIIEAVDRLKSEGFNVRLMFISNNMKNVELRYVQVQADIIVDELNAGIYGATSREAMMLGKPTICYINKAYKDYPEYFSELPIVSATEDTIYQKLKELIHDKDRRIDLGRRGREYAVKWHSPVSCAERYERVYDELNSKGCYNNAFSRDSTLKFPPKRSDVYERYVSSVVNGNFVKEIDSLTTKNSFIMNWGEYLELAWLCRKISSHIKKRNEEGICKFGELFEEALIELEFSRDLNALQLLENAKFHFEKRGKQFKKIRYEDYLFLISQAAFRSQKYEKFLELLFEIIKINDKHIDALSSLAEMHEKINRLQEAKILYERAYLIKNSDSSLLDKLKKLNNKLGFPEDHISIATEASKTN